MGIIELLLIIFTFFLLAVVGKFLGSGRSRIFAFFAKNTSRLIVGACCLAIPVYASGPLILLATKIGEKEYPIDITPLVIFLLYMPIPIFIAMVASVMLARMYLRTWPISLDRGVSKKSWFVLILLWSFFLMMIAFFISLLNQSQNSRALSAVLVVVSAQIPLVTICFSWSIYVWVKSRRISFLDSPFILFLRRFSTFSDRTIVSVILRTIPDRIPAIFIASPQNRAANWDPFVWAFSGMRIFHPFRSFPIQLETRDEDWRTTVSQLVQRASCIVIDISESSESIDDEIQMVTTFASRHRVITVADETRVANRRSSDSKSVTSPILYRPSYWHAIPRICLSLILIFFTGILWIQLTSPKNFLAEDTYLLSASFIVLAVMLLSIGPSIIRPSISRRVSRQIRQAIKAAAESH